MTDQYHSSPSGATPPSRAEILAALGDDFFAELKAELKAELRAEAAPKFDPAAWMDRDRDPDRRLKALEARQDQIESALAETAILAKHTAHVQQMHLAHVPMHTVSLLIDTFQNTADSFAEMGGSALTNVQYNDDSDWRTALSAVAAVVSEVAWSFGLDRRTDNPSDEGYHRRRMNLRIGEADWYRRDLRWEVPPSKPVVLSAEQKAVADAAVADWRGASARQGGVK